MKTLLFSKKSYTVCFLLVPIITCFVSGCGPLDDIQRAANAIESAEKQLSKKSDDWQVIIANLADQLEVLGFDISGELRGIVSNSIADAGNQAQCLVDKLDRKLVSRLQELRKSLLMNRQFNEDALVELYMPWICQVVPNSIDITADASPNKLRFNGFNLRTTSPLVRRYLKAYIVSVDEKGVEQEREITEHMTKSTFYDVEINLSGSGVPIATNDKRIELRWANNEVVSEVSVLQRETKSVLIWSSGHVVSGYGTVDETVKWNNNYSFFPIKSGSGDNDFATEKDPARHVIVDAIAKLEIINKKELWLRLSASFREASDDHTEASSSAPLDDPRCLLYTAKDGWEISKVDHQRPFDNVKLLMWGPKEIAIDPANFKEAVKNMFRGFNPSEFYGANLDGLIEAVHVKAYEEMRRGLYRKFDKEGLPSGFECTRNGLVECWYLRGDQLGDDVGTYTSVKVRLLPVKVIIARKYRD